MDEFTIAVKLSDIKRIGIICSCGCRSIAEIPKQIAMQRNLHTCPECFKMHIFQFKDGKWHHELPSIQTDEILFN